MDIVDRGTARAWKYRECQQLRDMFKAAGRKTYVSHSHTVASPDFLVDLEQGRVSIVVCRKYIPVAVVKRWANSVSKVLVVMSDDRTYGNAELKLLLETRRPTQGRYGQGDFYCAPKKWSTDLKDML